MDVPRFLGVRDTYSHAKLAAVLGATAAYLAAVLVRGSDAASILMLVTVPVVLAAWSFGVRAAVLASAVGFGMNGVIAVAIAGENLSMWLSGSGLLGTSVLLVVGVTVGRLRDLRVRLERELSERAQGLDARNLLAGIATNMAEGVCLIRASDGTIVYANEPFEEMFGYAAGELIGKHVSVVNAPGETSPEETARAIIETLNAAGVWRGDIQNVKKDGTAFWCHASVSTFEHHEHGTVWVSVHQDITERKRAEAVISELNGELEERVRQRQLIINQGPDSMFVSRIDNFMFTEVSDRACDRYGYSREEFLTLNIFDIEVEPPLKEAVRELYDDTPIGQVVEVYGTNKTKDGSSFPVHVRFAKLDDEFAIAHVRDITEQKLVEEALRDSEERYRDLFESAPVGIAVTDGDGPIRQTNPALESMLGRTKEELQGTRLSDYRPDGYRPPRGHAFDRLRSGDDASVRYERQFAHRNGAVVWAHITASAVASETGHVEHVFRMVEDITEQKRAEEALRESEERHRALFESSPMGIVISEARGVIVQTNPAVEKMLGRTGAELRGSLLRDFRPRAGPERDSRVFDRLANREPDTARFERQFLHSSGDIVWTHVTAASVPGQRGGRGYAFRIIEDITERKLVEAELQQAEEERLQRTRQLASIGELAAGVAHEINNPLNSVMGFTQLVLGEETLSEQARSDLRTVYSETQRASKIVQNLLSFARKREPERRPVDIRSVVERACHLKQYDFRKHTIELRTRFSQRLPQVLGDEQQLTEVVLNLLTNAEQAIASSERPGAVTVTCDASDGLVQITVANDGPAIPPEVLGRIFEPFFTTKEVGEGTGLGLSVCQGIVREHEGELWAESTPGGETAFYITLPVLDSPPTKPPASAAEPEHRPVTPMRILVVDDEPHARELIARALAKDEHQIEQATDGESAWRQIRNTHYDCVIADLRMPGMSGQELHRLVEESDPDLAARFIFVTGDTMSPDTLGFLSSAAGRSLTKPIDVMELRRAVAELQEAGETTEGPPTPEAGGRGGEGQREGTR